MSKLIFTILATLVTSSLFGQKDSVGKIKKNEDVLNFIHSEGYSNFELIKTSPSGWISAIKEKKVISNMATSGFYIFKDCKTFLSFYKETIFSNKEKYISDVYQTMLARNSRILNLYNINKEDTLILGTPDEYERWKKDG